MAILIKAESNDGHQRLCSAKCYNAHGPDCTCICNGMNHGAGPELAAQNTQHLSQAWVNQVKNRITHHEAQRLQACADQLALQLY